LVWAFWEIAENEALADAPPKKVPQRFRARLF